MLFELRASTRQGPVLLSSPHSGRLYPERLLAETRLKLAQFRPLEDGPVDMLLEPALAHAAGLLASLTPRAWIDLNRAPDEMDPAEIIGLFPVARERSAKVRAGLGLVPTRVSGQAIYRRRLVAEEIRERLGLAYRPFHAALANELSSLRALHGVAVLLDCHSMPSTSVARLAGGMAEIVLGDRHGSTASPAITDCVMRALHREGFQVALNRPFAGGYITEAYGSPTAGIHALQLEIRRDLFLNEADHSLHRGAGTLARAIAAVVEALNDATDQGAGCPAAA